MKRYNIDKTFFEKIDTEEKAYFLGILFADGYIDEKRGQCEISLQEKDRDILEKLNHCLKTDKPLTYKKSKNHWKTGNPEQASYRLYIKNRKMCDDLIKLGMRQNKSFTLEFPDQSIIPARLMRHFLRGYFDGDGCFCIKTNGQGTRYGCWSFISSTMFCESFQLKYKEKFRSTIQYSNKKYSRLMAYCYIFSIKNIEKMFYFLYKDLNGDLFLNRKREEMIKFLNEKGVPLFL